MGKLAAIAEARHPALRISIAAAALILGLSMPAAAQKKVTVEQVLTQLHGLCERDYKPACIRFGFVIGKLPPPEVKKWRAEHPDWWWWERW